MQILAAVLVAKITLTICLWSIPPLLFPPCWLRTLGFPVPEPRIFLRLLGMAYLSLAVGYLHGLQCLLGGVYPSDTVLVGIVSNGGAFVLLAISARQSIWKEWGFLARVIMWISLVGTGVITLGLVVFGPFRQH